MFEVIILFEVFVGVHIYCLVFLFLLVEVVCGLSGRSGTLKVFCASRYYGSVLRKGFMVIANSVYDDV